MLKISQIGPTNHAVTLRLEGRVVGPWVMELQKSCEEVLTEGRTLKLDLAELEFMDVHGVALLSSLRSRGVSLLECPPFAAEQLKTSANEQRLQFIFSHADQGGAPGSGRRR